ncbi:alpha/beta fold hydrolase [Lutibacter sp. HS1-25]|uniref:YheT family hydrolase n=1 Tax=Lutibacter sp. HS1-25 TaxID=2485000 RepID=UPI001011C10C|nr:alpha/beta fold hydrolase [Lutibacter sp. HS1-25]RXP45583.1 alpha/beta fold hydrolase [Lutibacter sp. HS1-25]
MPIIQSTYKPNYFFKNTHLNTIYKTLTFNDLANYKRTRISTPDNDFIDLDFSTVNSNTLVIALHGLEGSSNSKYIISLINYLNSQQIAAVAVNFRGCSGEDNNHLYSYNSGKSDDLSIVINYILNNCTYKNIIFVGYSMGGNILLKYLGEGNQIPSQIKAAIAISVPCDLEGSSNALAKWNNRIYINRFLKTLKEKSLKKVEKFPNNNLNVNAILNSKTFSDFDNAVTTPVFGYKNAKDYWTQCSSKQFLNAIQIPTLMINAKDDTFLSKSCFPFFEAQNSKHLFLETPKYGGHVGFNTALFEKDKLWSEKRIVSFIQHIIS